MTWFEQLPTLVRWAIEGLALVVILTVIAQILLAVLMGVVAWRESKSLKARQARAARRHAELRRRHGIDN